MLKDLDKYRYINSESEEISKFAKEMSRNTIDTKHIISNILSWFDENIEYSRLNSPYYPLQRNDIDTLRMKSGTCGDYSNLIVSTLLNLGIPAKYAYIREDCYGHNQDHICPMVEIDNNWVLVDATLPYRKWVGYNTPHKEYDIYTPEEFEEKFKKEEKYWANLALKWGEEKYAGLLYSPWIHEEVVINNHRDIETIFYLLVFSNLDDWNLYVYYLHYTPQKAISPVMAIINPIKFSYRFSVCEVESIWDEEQWSQEYALDNIPKNFKDERFIKLSKSIEIILNKIKQIIPNNSIDNH